MKTKVVIVIPTYNEVTNVTPTSQALAQVVKACHSHEFHILFVDDNSPDGTSRKIEQLMHKYPFIHLLNNKHKGGLGHAYKKGFMVAIDKYKADIIFEFDADLQHDPATIPAMIAAIENGADLVLGSRYIRGGGIPKTWPLYRKFLSIVGNLYIRIVMGNFKVRDWTTGYRAIRVSMIKVILGDMHSAAFEGYTWQIGFLVKTIQKGYKVVEVPFVFRDRENGHSKLGPEYIFNTMRYIMKARFDQILHSRILKFLLVGGFGTLIQLIALHFYRLIFQSGLGSLLTPYQIALILAIETAIISNFTWSNLWTFKDRKLKPIQIPAKFVQFNLASGGSLLIQFIIASVGERLIGLHTIFEFSISNFELSIDTGLIYAIIGILIGMFWNFFAYSHFVWRKKA